MDWFMRATAILVRIRCRHPAPVGDRGLAYAHARALDVTQDIASIRRYYLVRELVPIYRHGIVVLLGQAPVGKSVPHFLFSSVAGFSSIIQRLLLFEAHNVDPISFSGALYRRFQPPGWTYSWVSLMLCDAFSDEIEM